jgi:DNA mismatch repair protein MutS2
MDGAHIRRQLSYVEESRSLLAQGEVVPFERLADIRTLVARCRIEGNFLSAPDLLNVFEALQTSRRLRAFVMERRDRLPALSELCDPLIDDRLLEKHLTDAIDDTGGIRDTASRELATIRRDILDVSARLRNRLQRILKKFGDEELLQDEFISQRDGRFVLPLRVETKRSVEGIIHGVSASGQTVFMEPAETYEMNNELAILHGREQREMIRILTTLSAEVGAVSYGIDAAVDVMTELDSILARARFALDYGGIMPTIVDDPELEFTNVSHPVLMIQSRGTRTSVIPLSARFDAATRGMLISGPNAGGKTVAMKTIAISMVMAYSGIFPLGMCTLSPRRVMTAIGDHQSIESNLSTFSSQIIRLRDILSHSDATAMVFVDEICAGTDPAEGGALAAGILDSIIERGATFVVTTHQSSLKQYALTRPFISNASLEFDGQRMTPTFRFLPGVPGNSYAFVLAQTVGLPDVVLERAQGYLGDRHNELEKSITAMQAFRAEAEADARAAAEELAKARRLTADAEERLGAAKEKKRTAADDARAEAREILRKANALVENTIREIREQQKSSATIKSEFEQGKRELLETEQPATPETPVTPARWKVGSAVQITGTSSTGTLIELDEKGNSAMVEVNGIKFRIPLDQLTDGKSTKVVEDRQRRKAASPVDYLKLDASTNLDLRGMRVDEGLRALEDFINGAILGTIPFATIIHGKGTGAMRTAVNAYLKEHPHIQSYRLGTIHEGGDGITVVEFG